MVLGIDLGTGSVKALVLGQGGQVVSEASCSYAVSSPVPGWAESQPQAWYGAVIEAVREATQDHEISAIGFSGQMHGVVLCDAKAKPLRPAILWADTRATALLELYQNLKAEQKQRLANPLTAGMAGPSLLWLKANEPEYYKQAVYALQPKDWLRFHLTGEAWSEPSDASATLLYDVAKDAWADDVIADLDLRRDLLAPLKRSSDVAGSLSQKAAADFGLSAGLPLATGGADAACSAFGSGLVQAGQLQINIGTAMQIFAIRAEPSVDPTLRTHFYRTVLDDYYAMAAMQNAGIALEHVRSLLDLSWDAMYAEAFAVAPGCNGLSFLPYLTGERTPHLDPQARGGWHGLRLNHSRGHLARAAFEGVAFSLKDGFEALRTAGIEADALRLAGGGSVRPEWQQLLADILAKPLYAVSVPSASARGAALLAGLAVGSFKNVEETLEPLAPPTLVAEPHSLPELEAAYVRFQSLYPALKALR